MVPVTRLDFAPVRLGFHAVEDRPTLTGRQVAARLELSWERFRKVRASYTRDRDFPAELNEPGEAVIYDAAAFERWIERRSRRVHRVADKPAPSPVATAAVAREGRSQLRALKGR